MICGVIRLKTHVLSTTEVTFFFAAASSRLKGISEIACFFSVLPRIKSGGAPLACGRSVKMQHAIAKDTTVLESIDSERSKRNLCWLYGVSME